MNSHARQQTLMRPPILLLKEGTDVSRGKPQLLSNISSCIAISKIIQTTLGPRGMDKLIVSSKGTTCISNDGATLIRELEVEHPVGRVVSDIAAVQDAAVGDGTTSVIVLAGELFAQAKPLIEENFPVPVISRGYQRALDFVLKSLLEISIHIPTSNQKAYKEILLSCAQTSMSSKIIRNQREMFKTIVVEALQSLGNDINVKNISVKRVSGGALQESFRVGGVAFKKTFAYAGFEQQPKRLENPKIICLNIELELKSERDNAEVRISNMSEYQAIVDAEWNIIYDKLAAICNTGANVVLSKLPIGDLATQYFADRKIFCAGRVPAEDLDWVIRAVGGNILTSVTKVDERSLGTCGVFEERQVGKERFNFLTECPKALTSTIIVRGASEQFTAEVERSLHDAIMVTSRVMKAQGSFVCGGGAVEAELSHRLREHAQTVSTKDQIPMLAFAKALEVIPRTLSDNCGHDSIEVMNKIRKAHAEGRMWDGLDIETGEVVDNNVARIYEPLLVKTNSLSSATEAVCLVLSIDDTIKYKNPKARPEDY